ncbi:hypothetical protein Vi05172_g8527 [Venturia inaequalis]|nr:hypothetical protein Vi05172_g8527 [Venturia inaequalis]
MAIAVQNPSKKSTDSIDKLFKQYLRSKSNKYPQDIITDGRIDNDAIVEAFRWRAANLLSGTSRTDSLEEALEQSSHTAAQAEQRSVEELEVYKHALFNLILAYSEMILVVNYHRALQSSPLSTHTAETMAHLFQLYSLFTIDADARTFSTTKAVTPNSLDALSDTILVLMTEKIRPHAVKLVDSWAFPDYILDSALGRYSACKNDVQCGF